MRDDLFVVDSTGIVPRVTPPSGGSAAADAGALPTAAGSGSGSGSVNQDAGPPPSAGAGGTRPMLPMTTPFRWTETIPGAGRCQAATFTGFFSCTTDNVVGQNHFTGYMTLVLKGSSETQLLSIERGQILVYDDDLKLVVSTDLTGLLDCNTQQLIAALVAKNSEMMPLERILNWLNPNATPLVNGMLKGPLDPNLQVIRGDIQLVFDPMPKCPGTFSLQGMPTAMP